MGNWKIENQSIQKIKGPCIKRSQISTLVQGDVSDMKPSVAGHGYFLELSGPIPGRT